MRTRDEVQSGPGVGAFLQESSLLPESGVEEGDGRPSLPHPTVCVAETRLSWRGLSTEAASLRGRQVFI